MQRRRIEDPRFAYGDSVNYQKDLGQWYEVTIQLVVGRMMIEYYESPTTPGNWNGDDDDLSDIPAAAAA